MGRKVLLLDKEIYGEYFKGLILPEEREKLENEETFLIGAMEDGNPLGAVLWELEASRARLLSIAVESKHRRMGIGTALLRYSMKVLRQLECYGVYAITLPEEEATAGLLKSFGMVSEAEESASFKVTLEDVQNIKHFRGNSSHTIALREVLPSCYGYFLNQYFSMDSSMFEKKMFEQECSRFIVRNQKILAGIFVEKEENTLSVAWLHSVSNKPEDLLYLLQDAVKEAIKIYDGDTVITFTCFSETLLKIIQKLFGEKIECNAVQKWSMFGSEFRLAQAVTSPWERGE